jgi:hypothetical protein
VDPTGDIGGLLGSVALSDLRPELRSAVEQLRVGQLSPVVRVPTGFAFLMRVASDDAADASGSARPAVNPGVAAGGSVKYAFDVSGYSEAIIGLRQYGKPPDWNEDPRTVCRIRNESLAAAHKALEDFLASTKEGPSVPAFDLVQALFASGQMHAYDGKMTSAVAAFEKAHGLATAEVPTAVLVLEEALGVAYLHKAELDAGIYHAPGERCLLSVMLGKPIGPTRDVTKAIEHFSRYLAQKPEELEVRWLLNLAHMAAGTYPDKVPAPHLIPPDVFASAEDVGRFVDVAPETGLVSFASAGGVIVDDFDNDGRLDVVTSSFNSCQPMHFFRRSDNGMFVEQGVRAGLGDQVGGLNLIQTDYNNDGNLDILLLRGAWEGPQRKSLLRNDGNGRFTDVTVASGLAKPATSTQAAVWADIDNDGYLDLFIGKRRQPRTALPQQARWHVRRHRAGGRRQQGCLQQGRDCCRLRQRRLDGSLCVQPGGIELLLPQQPRRHVHRARTGCRCDGIRPGFRDLVLRLRQRRQSGPVCHQLLHVR